MHRVSQKMVVAIGLLVFTASQLNAQCCSLCGKKVCHLEVSTEKKDVTTFEVKPKEICIPGIKLPWECKRRCGGVRTICTLSEGKKEKTVCKYDWSIKTICTGCCSKHGLKRGARSCDVCKDDKVPFDYYALDAVQETNGGKAVSSQNAHHVASISTRQIGPLPSPMTPVASQAVARKPASTVNQAVSAASAEEQVAPKAKSTEGFRVRAATSGLWKKIVR